MIESSGKTNSLFGFLTVVELPTLGHCGGLLVVSRVGRPVEFHCTAPVAPNRAQEIMYGKTYQGFLFAEQIGMALVDKAKNKPDIFVTDDENVLPITEMIDSPLLFVEKQSVDEPFDGTGLKKFLIDQQPVYCINAKPDEFSCIRSSAENFASNLPFEEPFERIYSAIEEANQVLRAG